MENRVQRLTQLALRQEQLLANLRQDMMLYLFVRSGDTGLIPVLCQSADRWRQLKEESPGQISMFLKLAMFKQLLISLQERLTETAKDAKAMDYAKSLGWLDQDQQWRVLRWNSTQQHLEVEESIKPTSTNDLIGQNVQVRKGVTEDSLLRFKSIRRLSPDVNEGGLDSIPACHQSPSGGIPTVGDSEVMDRPILVAHTGVPPEEGQAPIRLPHGGSLELLKGTILSLKSLLKLALSNTSQLCYLNSTAYAATWTILQAKLHGAEHLDMAPALRTLCKPRPSQTPLKLLAQLPWAALLQGCHRQHDAPELVTHLMPRMGIHHAERRWEAQWSVNQHVQVFDQGTLLAPISVSLPPQKNLHLQQVINKWHEQARLHALVTAPALLCVQLNRFIGEDGELSRDTRPLQGMDSVIYIPVYTADATLQTRRVPSR